MDRSLKKCEKSSFHKHWRCVRKEIYNFLTYFLTNFFVTFLLLDIMIQVITRGEYVIHLIVYASYQVAILILFALFEINQYKVKTHPLTFLINFLCFKNTFLISNSVKYTSFPKITIDFLSTPTPEFIKVSRKYLLKTNKTHSGSILIIK